MYFFSSLPEINECVNVTCQNGGTCQDGVNQYTCQCVAGFRGTHCEEGTCKMILSVHNGEALTLANTKNNFMTQCVNNPLFSCFLFWCFQIVLVRGV